LKDVVILGGKGGGTLAAQTVVALGRAAGSHRLVGYLNDRLQFGTQLHGGAVIGRFEDWSRLDGRVGFVAPLHKVGFIQQNASRTDGLGVPAARWITLIDPDAKVADGVQIGEGSVVAANAQVGPDSVVGSHCFLRAGSIVSHDVSVSDHVYLGQNSVVLGYGRIDTGAHISPGAIVRDGASIGRFAVVGMGSVVATDIPAFAIVQGVPARVTGYVTPLD
jgi:carbonic anhydrase/acetyltransferase-like protein (isoleucine patch superfamily)